MPAVGVCALAGWYWDWKPANDRDFIGLPITTVSQNPSKQKQWSQELPFRGLLRFLYVYLWQRGFLDGREGYYFARLHGVYEFLSVAKTYELKRQARREGGAGLA